MEDADEGVIPLVEERVTIGKRLAVRERVRVSTVTATEEERVAAELAGEEVEVTRVPVDAEVAEAGGIREEDGVTIIPVYEERMVVEKRLFLKEEIHVRRRPTLETVDLPVSLRRQHAVIDRRPEAPASTPEQQED